MIEKFEVTQELINMGKPRNGCQCPIALAINIRHTDGGAGAYCCWYNTSDMFDYSGPVKHFVHNFDHKLNVKPFILVLDLDNMRAYMESEVEEKQ